MSGDFPSVRQVQSAPARPAPPRQPPSPPAAQPASAEPEALSIPFNQRTVSALCIVIGTLCVLLVPLFGFAALGALGMMHIQGPVRLEAAVILLIIPVCWTVLIGWVGGLWQSVRRGESAIILTPEGLIDNVSGYRVGLIPWNELASVYHSSGYLGIPGGSLRLRQLVRLGEPLLVLAPRRPDYFLTRLPAVRAASYRMDQRRWNGCLVIGGRMLGIAADEAEARIRDYVSRLDR